MKGNVKVDEYHKVGKQWKLVKTSNRICDLSINHWNSWKRADNNMGFKSYLEGSSYGMNKYSVYSSDGKEKIVYTRK